MSYMVFRDNGEVGSLVAALHTLIGVVSKLDDASMNQVLKVGGELAQACGDRPLFSNKADYLDHLRDLEKRLQEHSKEPLLELDRDQWTHVLSAVVKWQDKHFHNDTQMIVRLTKLRDAASRPS